MWSPALPAVTARVDFSPPASRGGSSGMPGYGLDGPRGGEGVRYRAFGYSWP